MWRKSFAHDYFLIESPGAINEVVKAHDLHGAESIEFLPSDADLLYVFYHFFLLGFGHNLFDGLI